MSVKTGNWLKEDLKVAEKRVAELDAEIIVLKNNHNRLEAALVRSQARVTELETELELLQAGANKLGPENRRLKAELQAERDLANRNADEMERMRQEIRRSRAGLKKVQELTLIVDAAAPGEIDASPVLEDLREALKTAGFSTPSGDSSADTGGE
jgi:chromosome segregation ATPase